jgi:preprotein translocase SecE subunit
MAESIETVPERGKVTVVRDFLLDTRVEMSKVSWPAKEELIKATRAVIIGSMVLGLTIGIVDRLLRLILINGVSALVR